MNLSKDEAAIKESDCVGVITYFAEEMLGFVLCELGNYMIDMNDLTEAYDKLQVALGVKYGTDHRDLLAIVSREALRRINGSNS